MMSYTSSQSVLSDKGFMRKCSEPINRPMLRESGSGSELISMNRPRSSGRGLVPQPQPATLRHVHVPDHCVERLTAERLEPFNPVHRRRYLPPFVRKKARDRLPDGIAVVDHYDRERLLCHVVESPENADAAYLTGERMVCMLGKRDFAAGMPLLRRRLSRGCSALTPSQRLCCAIKPAQRGWNRSGTFDECTRMWRQPTPHAH
ncbi:MAG TPA: hypothetical protein VK531_00655 [Gemmatimonadales bacterium]|nr:hypothetical protein [Gemmatimonadales bacterium]